MDYTTPIDPGANVLRIKFIGNADFSADVTLGLAPLNVNFTNLSTVPNQTSWLWDFGDGIPVHHKILLTRIIQMEYSTSDYK